MTTGIALVLILGVMSTSVTSLTEQKAYAQGSPGVGSNGGAGTGGENFWIAGCRGTGGSGSAAGGGETITDSGTGTGGSGGGHGITETNADNGSTGTGGSGGGASPFTETIAGTAGTEVQETMPVLVLPSVMV